MSGFIDIHHHVLYGIDDDGPRTREDMYAMLEAAAEDGIGIIIATSHVEPGLRRFDWQIYNDRLQEANDYCRERSLPLTVLPGAELLYTSFTCNMLREGRVPTLAGSEYVLVEFTPGVTYPCLQEALNALNRAGYIPVLAHIERYLCLLKHPKAARNLKNSCLVHYQINCRTIVENKGFWVKRFLRSVFQQGLIDAIATDAHNVGGRRVCMREGITALQSSFGRRYVETLFELPQAIIGH